MLTDYHNHCLAGMDDGAENIEVSERIIGSLKAQGVGRVVVTPHFYGHDESPDSFLRRRAESLDSLRQKCPEMDIIPGCEVRLERGISAFPMLGELKMGSSRHILLEPPYESLRPWIPDEIMNIAFKFRLIPVIAHVERYAGWYSKDDMGQLLSIPDAVFQLNNQAVINRSSRRFAIGLIEAGYPVVFGSDAHNMDSRAPDFGAAQKILNSKLSKAELRSLSELNEKLISDSRAG